MLLPFPLSMAHQHMHVLLLFVEEQGAGGHWGSMLHTYNPGFGGQLSAVCPFIDVHGMMACVTQVRFHPPLYRQCSNVCVSIEIRRGRAESCQHRGACCTSTTVGMFVGTWHLGNCGGFLLHRV